MADETKTSSDPAGENPVKGDGTKTGTPPLHPAVEDAGTGETTGGPHQEQGGMRS